MFFIKLTRLYHAVVLLVGKFGTALVNDVEDTFAAVASAVASKSWTDLEAVVADAEKLYTDFLVTWNGSQDQVGEFLAALCGLFTK